MDDDVELVWGHILPNCKLWEVNGKKNLCYYVSFLDDASYKAVVIKQALAFFSTAALVLWYGVVVVKDFSCCGC